MGCDIHACIDYHDDIGRTTPWAIAIEIPRSYLLFALMAGVRNSSKDPVAPVSLPKGLPCDVSSDITAFFDDIGCHSFSWMSVAEIDAVLSESRVRFPEMLAVRAAMAALSQARLVFAFDN